jgi:quinol monooxygenase YgiN
MNGKATSVTVLYLKPGLEELLLPELAPIVEATRQISGCLSFDLYRLCTDRYTLVLHETWETREAEQGYALSPLKTELTRLLTRVLAQPMRTWDVEEVC